MESRKLGMVAERDRQVEKEGGRGLLINMAWGAVIPGAFKWGQGARVVPGSWISSAGSTGTGSAGSSAGSAMAEEWFESSSESLSSSVFDEGFTGLADEFFEAGSVQVSSLGQAEPISQIAEPISQVVGGAKETLGEAIVDDMLTGTGKGIAGKSIQGLREDGKDKKEN